jgi:hypothetical protein
MGTSYLTDVVSCTATGSRTDAAAFIFTITDCVSNYTDHKAHFITVNKSIFSYAHFFFRSPTPDALSPTPIDSTHLKQVSGNTASAVTITFNRNLSLRGQGRFIRMVGHHQHTSYASLHNVPAQHGYTNSQSRLVQ